MIGFLFFFSLCTLCVSLYDRGLLQELVGRPHGTFTIIGRLPGPLPREVGGNRRSLTKLQTGIGGCERHIGNCLFTLGKVDSECHAGFIGRLALHVSVCLFTCLSVCLFFKSGVQKYLLTNGHDATDMFI